ncbi:MAG: hypothetical protein ACWGHV_08720 [Stutzerimonas stutzeri]
MASWSGAMGPLKALTTTILRPVARPFSAEGGLRAAGGQPRARRDQDLRRGAGASRGRGAGADLLRPAASWQPLSRPASWSAISSPWCVSRGRSANGMPELHKLTPFLGVLQDRGYKVALVTDGRMSGASGKVPAAIHVCPEALDGGPLALVRDGDSHPRRWPDRRAARRWSTPPNWATRQPAIRAGRHGVSGCGRELFAFMRASFSTAEQGASAFTESLEALK